MLSLLIACAPPDVALGPPDVRAVDGAASSDDVLVDCEGGGDFLTIGRAIAAADPGDTIRVAPCTYEETVDFGGKTLRIESTDGPDVTTIQADGTDAVVIAEAGEGDGTAIAGFTLTGGGGSIRAAVNVDFASLRLEDDVVTGNRGVAALYGASADLVVDGTTFEDNRGTWDVIAWADRGAVVVSDSTFDCGTLGYGLYFSHGAGFVDRTTFWCDDGWSVGDIHAIGEISRSTLHGGFDAEQEFDHYDDYVLFEDTLVDGPIVQQYAAVWVRNSVVRGGVQLTNASQYTIVEGSVLMDADCGLSADAAGITVRNNLFSNVDATTCGVPDVVGRDGNLAGDPLFVDADGGDYHLGAGSPAIDAGPADNGYADVDGSRNDIGIYGGPLSQDGGR